MDVVHYVFLYFGSMWVFGITAIAHVFILAAVVLTVATFETARQRPNFFVKFPTSTPSRSRNMYWNGQKIKLDPNDKGGNMNNYCTTKVNFFLIIPFLLYWGITYATVGHDDYARIVK